MKKFNNLPIKFYFTLSFIMKHINIETLLFHVLHIIILFYINSSSSYFFTYHKLLYNTHFSLQCFSNICIYIKIYINFYIFLCKSVNNIQLYHQHILIIKKYPLQGKQVLSKTVGHTKTAPEKYSHNLNLETWYRNLLYIYIYIPL